MLPRAEWSERDEARGNPPRHLRSPRTRRANVEFYAGTLGLRLVKKTVNQDDPTVYHLFYADEAASAGADITFFEYPGSPRGRAGAGMVHRVVFRVGSEEALDFWADAHRRRARASGRCCLERPGRARARARRRRLGDEPLTAAPPGDPSASSRCAASPGVRAYSADHELERGVPLRARLHAGLGVPRRAARRLLRLRRARRRRGDCPGAGTVHHVAWASTLGRPRGVAREACSRSAASRRPSSTASTSARSTSASRVASSSRSRRSGRASRSDEPRGTPRRAPLAAAATSSRCASELEARLTPLPDPRAAEA